MLASEVGDSGSTPDTSAMSHWGNFVDRSERHPQNSKRKSAIPGE